MTPTVSIIVPAFNAAQYIGESLASATAQTLRSIEIIVVDDASTDATAAIVESAAARDSRIQLLRQPVNAGPSAARNRAIDAARGTWIALLDADDSYLPDRLERLVAAAERNDASVCADNLLLVADAAEPRLLIAAEVLPNERSLDLAEFIRRNIADKRYPDLNLGFLKPLISRLFLVEHGIRYDESVRFAEDFALYADCFTAGGTWWLMPYAGYRYRQRAGSLTHIQTVADLAALRRKQAALRLLARGDPALEVRIATHARTVDRNYFYRRFTDAFKARQFAAMQHAFFSSRVSGWLIIQETMNQLPKIIKKAIRGGYLSKKA